MNQIIGVMEKIGRNADLLDKDDLAVEAVEKAIGLNPNREILEQLLGAGTAMFSALIPSEDDEEKKDDDQAGEGGPEEEEPTE